MSAILMLKETKVCVTQTPTSSWSCSSTEATVNQHPGNASKCVFSVFFYGWQDYGLHFALDSFATADPENETRKSDKFQKQNEM